ncbi:dense granule protein GRA11, partial [Toxoplasma gondii COUG]
MSRRMASRSRLLFAAFCAGGVLLGAGPPAARQSAFTVASTVAGGETGYTSSLEVESPENVGVHEGDENSQHAHDEIPVEAAEGEEVGSSRLSSSNRSRTTHATSATRRGSRSRLLLPAALISALALSGLIGSSMMKETAEETGEPRAATPEKQADAKGAPPEGAKVVEQEGAQVAHPEGAQVAEEDSRSRQRRMQAAVLAAVLVAAVIYGVYDKASLTSPTTTSSESGTSFRHPELALEDSEADLGGQLEMALIDASHETPGGAPSEGMAGAVSSLIARVVDGVVQFLQDPASQRKSLGMAASAVALAFLAAGALRARQAAKALTHRPAPPPASKEQGESAQEALEELEPAPETQTEQVDQASMPLPPAPEDFDLPPMPLPEAPEDFDQAPMPLPEAAEEFDQAPMPLPEAAEVFDQAPMPLPEAAE